LGNVEEGLGGIKEQLDRYNAISAQMGEPDADFDALLAEMGELQEALEHADAWDLDSQLEQAMDALRCPPPDAMVDILSGGERRRVALCKLLLQQPDLLLLDEPTNHLDAESVHWLEGHLKAYPGAVLAVTHDRYFLDNVAQWILELDRGRTHPYEGNYSTYLDTKKSRLQIEGKRDAKRAKILERELDWARSNPKARQAKNKARLVRYEEMAAEAERNRKLDFEEINIPAGPRLGSTVLESVNLVKGFGDRLLFNGLSFSLPRAGIVGVVGPNGVGKSTLFRMLVGEETPDSGELRLGESVKISYVDQGRSGLDPKKNVWELVSDGLDFIKVGSFEMPSRAYVASFGFKGPDQQKLAGVLSGGERNRLNLALTLKMGGNLLLLDEPTNDLDVETLQSLEDALLEFPGCAVLISHDRWFLDRVVTHILAWEGDDDDQAKWFWYEGNFADYEINKIARLGAEAARPHRATHRRLTRA
ncbi:MAG TPA: energy-dependent translational throttle protein EttA, partial [Propionibacteriaceae bacterium]|nr:energy-dependent translational throttle protein EttA [Propionibacteriaceae bacterium]